MADQDSELPFGLYERLITSQLKARLLRFDLAKTRIVKTGLDPAEAHATLAQHIEGAVARALNAFPLEDRAARQSALTNEILRLIAWDDSIDGLAGDLVEHPPEQLRAIQRISGIPSDDRDVVAPLVPLSASDLLVNARGEPALAHALAREIPSADSIDLLCAFVRWHGLRLLRDQIETHRRAGRKTEDGQTMPYTCLGLADYISHKGERPISFVWELRRPMPADFFRHAKMASG